MCYVTSKCQILTGNSSPLLRYPHNLRIKSFWELTMVLVFFEGFFNPYFKALVFNLANSHQRS